MFANMDRIAEARSAALRIEVTLRLGDKPGAWRSLGALFHHINVAMAEDGTKLSSQLCQAALVRGMQVTGDPIELANRVDKALEGKQNVLTWREYGELQASMEAELPADAETAGELRSAFVEGQRLADAWEPAPPPPELDTPILEAYVPEPMSAAEPLPADHLEGGSDL